MNKFRKWVTAVGVKEIAGRLQLNWRTVYFWVQGEGSPTAPRMQQLVKMGNGAFTYQDLIDCTVNKKK